MKKTYIKPSINVLEMTENEAILAASDGTTGTGGYDGVGIADDEYADGSDVFAKPHKNF